MVTWINNQYQIYVCPFNAAKGVPVYDNYKGTIVLITKDNNKDTFVATNQLLSNLIFLP